MEHRTDTVVDEQRGVQAYCWTCEGPVGPEHGLRDAMGNVEALLAALADRDRHEANPAGQPVSLGY